jgi:hypothetical protein
VKQIRKRLTYANVMSSIAVFLVLGGATAFAAGLAKNSVGSKQIKKNAVTTAKIKNGAVNGAKIQDGAITGAKVNLGTLGTVPNATHASTADKATSADKATTATTADKASSANSAANAGNADTVGGVGVAEINYNGESVSSGTVIYSRAGLTLTAGCAAGDNIEIAATTSKANASIYTTVVDTDADDNNLNDDEESGGFDPGADFDLLAGNDGNPGLITFEYDANDGTTVTGTLSVDEDNSDGAQCQAHGVVFNA